MLLRYHLRSLFVRRSSTILTVIGIAATVATLAGVMALNQGFRGIYTESGRKDVAVLLRLGASSEGFSGFSRETAQDLIKSSPEIALDADQQPLASMECYLAVRRKKLDGGETNVPLRGVQPATFAIRKDELRVLEGRLPTPGSDEVLVGAKLPARIRDCSLNDVIVLNVTPFRVVGVFETDGPFDSEIWGDFERMLAALGRSEPNRVIAQLEDPGAIDAMAARLEIDQRNPAKVWTEAAYLESQTAAVGTALLSLGVLLGVIMGLAAIFTATGTMLSAISARTSEIGILLSNGYRPLQIFLSFLGEALVLGLIGGLVGCLAVLPINGIQTGTTNWASFTEVAFAFRVTPSVLVIAVVFSVLLGLLGGAWPALAAARMRPAEALRRT